MDSESGSGDLLVEQVMERVRFLRQMGYILTVGGWVMPHATYCFYCTRPR